MARGKRTLHGAVCLQWECYKANMDAYETACGWPSQTLTPKAQAPIGPNPLQ